MSQTIKSIWLSFRYSGFVGLCFRKASRILLINSSHKLKEIKCKCYSSLLAASELERGLFKRTKTVFAVKPSFLSVLVELAPCARNNLN